MIGDLAFAAKCRGRLLRDSELLQHLQRLANEYEACPPPAPARQDAGDCVRVDAEAGDIELADEDASEHMGDVVGSRGQGKAAGEEDAEAAAEGLIDQKDGVRGKAEVDETRQRDHWYADMFAPYEKRWWGKFHVAGAARRALVILGEKRVLSNAGQVPGAHVRGLRVLCIDGGGVKGIVALRMLAHLEHVLGRPLWQVFDLVAGTSAGGIIATSISSRIPISEVERLYDKVVLKAFSVMMQHSEDASDAAAARDPATASWWQKLYQSGSSMKRSQHTRTRLNACACLIGKC
jgi:hypothetical protein